MRIMLGAAAVAVAALVGCNQGGGRGVPPREEIRAQNVNPGVKALAGLQAADGSFSRAEAGADVGVTALAGIALLASGDGLAQNTYAANVRKATDFLLARQNDRGFIGILGSGTSMYGHGFATLYLAQVYALTPEMQEKQRVGAALEKAVRLTEKAQNSAGGWGYSTDPGDADVSVSTGQLKALLAAQQVGIRVSKKAIDDGLGYIRSMQNEDGGFRYNATERSSVWARSAAAVATLLYTGASDDKVRAGIDYLGKAATPGSPNKQFQYYYGNYYLAQALSLAPKGERLSFDELIQSVLERQDRATGLWHGEAGDAYATATALIVLEMRGTTLPAFKPKM